MSENENVDKFLNAVLFGTPDEARSIMNSGGIEYTGRALGAACRFRGLDMVKALVENGANFRCPREWDAACIFSKYRGSDPDYSLCLFDITDVVKKIYNTEIELKILPISERLRILEYLLDNAEKVDIFPEKLLFFSIRREDMEIYECLKSRGICFSDDNKRRYMHSYSAFVFASIGSYRLMVRELGHEFLDRYTRDKISLMQYLINNDAADCLAELENYGWFKAPKRRDELIQYASEKGKTECAAWLLEYKNRTADLAAERAKAEKKMERALDAALDPVIELKKTWWHKKQEDGSVIITGYKGNLTEITVPEKIGESPVTAIGEYAFSPNALRLTKKQARARCRITKITVPPGVRSIGENAFGGEGRFMGKFKAFSLLEEVILPDTLEMFADKKSAENAPQIFVNCPKLTVKIPHSPYAELYCGKHNLNYAFR